MVVRRQAAGTPEARATGRCSVCFGRALLTQGDFPNIFCASGRRAMTPSQKRTQGGGGGWGGVGIVTCHIVNTACLCHVFGLGNAAFAT